MTVRDIDFSSKIKSVFKSNENISTKFVDRIISFLETKVKDHNGKFPKNKISLSQVKEVYKRGVGDGIRLEKPVGLWAIARINMFCKMAKQSTVPSSYKKLDRDIINDQSFFIDDGFKDDVIFSYEQISESKFESESFNLNTDEDYTFVDLEEYAEANFPKVLKESDIIKDDVLKNEEPSKFKSEEDEEEKKKKKKSLDKVSTKYKKEE